MKLLICTQAVDRNDPALGFFHRWVEEFARHSESVLVVCLRKGDMALPKNVEVIALGERGKFLRALEVCAIALGRRREYDAVFVHMNPEYVLAAGWLWRLLGKRVGLWYVHKSVTTVLRAALPFVHRVFTASQESFRIESPKVHVVGHGIDVDAYAHVARAHGDTIRLVTAGRIARAKQPDRMLRVLALLLRRGRTATLDIIGAPAVEADKAYQRELEQLIIELHLSDAVNFLGAVPHEELPDALSGHSVFLNLSETGSLDKAVIEALAAGLPVVTSNEAFARGFPVEFVSHDIHVIAEAIERAEVVESESLRAFVYEHYGLELLIGKVMAIYGRT